MSTSAENAPIVSSTEIAEPAGSVRPTEVAPEIVEPASKPDGIPHSSTVQFEDDVRAVASPSRMSDLGNPILGIATAQDYFSTQMYEDVDESPVSAGANTPYSVRNDARRTELDYISSADHTVQPSSVPRPTAPQFFADDNHVGLHQRVTRKRTQMPQPEGERPSKEDQQLAKEYTEEHEKMHAPAWAKIGAFFIIAVLVGITNALMVMVQYWLNKFRLTTLQHYWSEEEGGNWLLGALGSAGVSAFYCGLAAIMVLYLAPKAAGSGLPEMKGYLNGCKITGMFGRMGWVRAIGAVLTVSSGMPLGREGPMVSTGGQIGISIVDFLMKRFYKEKIDAEECGESSSPNAAPKKVLDVTRFKELRRQGAMLGAAAGVAAAFNAPIGGCLYIYEEVAGVMKWDTYLTVMALTVSAVATYVSYAVLNSIEFTRSHLGALVLTGGMNRNEGNVQYNAWDVMGAILVGIVTALFTRIFAKCLLKVAKMRTQKKWNNMLRLAEVMCCVFIVGFALSASPQIFGCTDVPQIGNAHAPSWTCALNGSNDGHHRMLASDGHHLSTHNEVATFNIQGLESGLQFLLDQSPHHYQLTTLLWAFIIQVLGCLLIFSLPMPIGMFIPNLFFGAIIGRFMGEVFHIASPASTYASAGVFAYWGMGGALAGFTHFTLAIAVLIVEATHDINNSVPLVACIIVARLVAGAINHEGFDEEMLVLKNVPFLHHEMPKALNRELAGHLMEETPAEAQINESAKILSIGKTLNDYPKLPFFPVVNERGQVVGVVDRSRLTNLFLQFITPKKYAQLNEEAKTMDSRQEEKLEATHAKIIRNYFAVHGGTINLEDHTPVPDAYFPLKQLMEPTRFLVIPSMPCARFYNLFVTMQLTCVTVVDSRGAPVGLIPRENLVKSATEAPKERFQEVIRRTTLAMWKKAIGINVEEKRQTLQAKNKTELANISETGNGVAVDV